MAVSRRSVLLQGSAIGAGIVTANITGMEAFAQNRTPRRRSVGEMAPNDPVLEAYREGVARLRERRSSDRISWANLASIHGTQTGFNRCPHGNWYFLPWHRAFLVMYENIIRDITNYREFAMPYWDWTRDRRLPRAFTDQNWRGRPNPLYEASRSMQARDSLPDENVGPTVIRDILSQANFEIFGTSRPRGQNSTDASWISRRTGNQGPLEANPHNNVHAIVGGLMSSSRSANDPIFLMHHCNVDRLWGLWNAAGNRNTTVGFWLNMEFRNHFLNPQGQEYSVRVRDLLDTNALGYNYGLGAEVAAAPAPQQGSRLSAFRERMRTFFRRFGDAEEEGGDGSDAYTPGNPNVRSPQVETAQARTFETSNIRGQGEATRPLEVAVKIASDLISNTAKRVEDPGSGIEYLDLPGQRERSAQKPRALAFIRNVDCTKIDATMIRVFVDCDYLSQGTPITDDHYAGTFGFFGNGGGDNATGGGGHGSHGDDKPSMVVDLTETLEKLYGSEKPPEEIRVQLLPAPNLKAKVADCGRVIPASIEIAFV